METKVDLQEFKSEVHKKKNKKNVVYFCLGKYKMANQSDPPKIYV